ncbi:maleylpyruvate isomerase [Austwickia chelonae]|uniref:Mycothiol-dependent maleylpyruvate isomerase metal-binding domain-containing protein n=1 Tax=Austwickia chelonae NBRC 105200 TaxID=1184607 RepID=K6V4V8_9MICO|nr:maleylpyruvate isomerase N-terminal domain-containing protein [Austwickia chelonae]GAB77213.1 hypothetical protein AUCHE_05_01180 [Austwickia chelonae NBRC 105200]SEW05289.1 maleylpyruvate isomerase [Austwickia chelonae]
MTDTEKTAPGGISDVYADLELLDLETRSLLQSVAGLTEADLAGPSRRSGCTRGQVVSQLARDAEVLVRLVVWARTGVRTVRDPSEQIGQGDDGNGVSWSTAEQEIDLVEACDLLGDALGALTLPLASPVLELVDGPVSAQDLPRMRLQEVVLSHADLGCGWELASAHPLAVADLLAAAVSRLGAAPRSAGFTVVSDEGDRFVVGDGSRTVRGPADALLAWLSWGVVAGIRCDDGLPVPETP